MSLTRKNLDGLDAGRVLALILVVYQHVCTLLDHEDATIVYGLSAGQMGVAMFLAISGLLAADTSRPPFNWLVHRLRRVYPAFWIVLVFSFFLVWVSGIKSVDIYLILAQFSGFGLFSHLDRLINSPTWFVSLLLVCYLGTYFVRLTGVPFILSIVISLILFIAVGIVHRPWLTSHLLTYAVAFTITLAQSSSHRKYLMMAYGILLLVLIPLQPLFCYTLLTMIILELLLYVNKTYHYIKVMSSYSYEFYLIHGVFLYGFIRTFPNYPILAVTVAIAVSAVGAVLLHVIVSKTIDKDVRFAA